MPIPTTAPGPVIYGWDASHYDGTLTTAILTTAKAGGIAFFTHKLGEGTGNVDDTAATALAAARDAGIQVIGGYWFCHNADDPVAEADRMVARADADESWWRDFPGWFWQADCETETETGAGKPSLSWIVKFADRLVASTGQPCIVYASHGEYGDTLTGVGHPLWNANYPSSRAGTPAALYPGNGYAGWAAYSGQTPVIAQFSSSATIAGHTTCDANAFRGTVDDLLTLIGADMPITTTDVGTFAKTDGQFTQFGWISTAKTNPTIALDTKLTHAGDEANGAHVQATAAAAGIVTANASLAGLTKSVAGLTTAIQTIAAGGSSIDTATVIAAINAEAAKETAAFTAQAAQITALQQLVTTLKAELAAAAQAAATDLAK